MTTSSTEREALRDRLPALGEPVVRPLNVCEDCGAEVEPDVHPLGLFRPIPGSPAGKGKRAHGRRWREWVLCRRCRALALWNRSLRGGTVHENGIRRHLLHSERIPPRKGGRPRLLTDRQLRAAHTLYTRGEFTLLDVAQMMSERGFGGVKSLEQALRQGWLRLRLPFRAAGKSRWIARRRNMRAPLQPIEARSAVVNPNAARAARERVT